MAGTSRNSDQLVFGLDIGTRSVVGSVGYMERGKFNVVAHYVKEHETRAMMDGQIHDIQKVGETIGFVKHELERQLDGQDLSQVCIAAAGRLLKTVTVHVEQERTEDTPVSSEDIYALDSLGIERAYDIIRADNDDLQFYCVGYTVVKYYMNQYIVTNLEGHKAKHVAADVLATFLPYDVVDGLYAAVNTAGLEVASLTLEPIAAMNVAIPEQYRLLNIALVDVGAGTSDICITKDGSIVAYGMIPHAGDELTESIVHQCLVEFRVAEDIKRASLSEEDIVFSDIMGLEQTMTAQEVRALYEDVLTDMTKEIADKIIELNGGKPVSAVFVVGGGGKVPGFTEKISEYLQIPKQRVALRGKEVLGDVNFLMNDVKKDPLLVTPIGICVNYYNQKNNFIFVNINDIRIKLYDNDHLTVVDAAIQIGFPNENLFPKRGRELVFTLNGITKMLRGEAGEPAVITLNGRPADFHSKISANDRISIKESTSGDDAYCRVEYLREYKEQLTFEVNGTKIQCPKFVTVNGEPMVGSYEIKENDVVNIPQYYTVAQIMEFMDLDIATKQIEVNGHPANDNEPVYEDFKITIQDKGNYTFADLEQEYENTAEEDNFEDVLGVVEPEPEVDSEKSEEDSEEKEEAEEVKDIHVTVNASPITMQGKASYIFADVFDYYPFDTKKVQGIALISRINGRDCMFMEPLKEGDAVEIFWQT